MDLLTKTQIAPDVFLPAKTPKSLSSTVPSSSSLSFLAPPPAPFGSVQDFQSPPIYPLHCKQWGPLDFLMVLRIELEFQRSWTPPRCVTRLLLTTTPPPPSSPCCSGSPVTRLLLTTTPPPPSSPRSPDIAAHHTPTPLVALIDMFVP